MAGQPPIALVPALVSFCGFALSIWSDRFLNPPPHLVRPVLTRYLGRYVFLTVQTNLLCCAYCFGCVVAALLAEAPVLDDTIVRAFPCVFMTATFLTPAYYVLDHRNPESRRMRKRMAEEYPHVELAMHLQHAHATPLALLLAASLTVAPANLDVLHSCGGFIFFYLFTSTLNRAATGEWMYPFLDEIERSRGRGGVAATLALIMSVGAGLGGLGRAIVLALQVSS